jgi:chitinase
MIYSFVKANISGDVIYGDASIDSRDGLNYIGRFTALRKISPSVKFLVSIKNNGEDSPFSYIGSFENLRREFAQNVVKFVNNHDFDGVDIAWEYPKEFEKTRFVMILNELANELGNAKKEFCVTVNAIEREAKIIYDIPQIVKSANFINLATYNFRYDWDLKTGFHSPLYKGPNDVGVQEEWNVNASVNYWLSQGCPPEKLIVGIPTYGRTQQLSKSDVNHVGAPVSGKGRPGHLTKKPGLMSFSEICLTTYIYNWTTKFETIQKAPYAYEGDQWIGYDDMDSVTLKSEYIINKNLGGALFSSIEMDDVRGGCRYGKYPLITMGSLILNVTQRTSPIEHLKYREGIYEMLRIFWGPKWKWFPEHAKRYLTLTRTPETI